MGKIILASSSPRRADILKKHNYQFEIIPSPYQEDKSVTDFSYSYVEDLAFGKAESVVPLVLGDAKIIGADTVVVLDDKILGKPKDYQDAFLMLKSLAGRQHKVVSAIAVIDTGTRKISIKSTTSVVEFNPLTDEQIVTYLKEYQPFDKAGSYGIQEMPEGYIKCYEGSFENIVGLCSETLSELLNA